MRVPVDIPERQHLRVDALELVGSLEKDGEGLLLDEASLVRIVLSE